MAGDWIKIRCDLPNDPDVMRLSDILGTDDPTTVGHLVAFWAWADKQTTDGTNIAITSLRLDRLIGRPGFTEAMRQIGWLSGRDGSLCLPRHERHNGNSAKARAMEAEAKRLRRLEQKELSDKLSDTCPTETGQFVGPEKRREEKRREEDEDEEQLPPLDFAKSKPDSPHRRATMEEVYKLGRGQMPPISDDCCEKFFDRMTGEGWINKHGFPLDDWRGRFREWAGAWATNSANPNRKYK